MYIISLLGYVSLLMLTQIFSTRIFALFFSLCLIACFETSCSSSGTQSVEFQVQSQPWFKALQKGAVNHYGILIFDTLEQKEILSNPKISPNSEISVRLEKKRPYYILLITYDEQNHAINSVEKEFSI